MEKPAIQYGKIVAILGTATLFTMLLIYFQHLVSTRQPEVVSSCSSLYELNMNDKNKDLQDNYVWYEGKRWVLDALSIDYKDNEENEWGDNHLSLEFIN